MTTAPKAPATGSTLAQNVNLGLAVATSLVPLFPGVGLAVTVATGLLNAVMEALASGKDITDEQINALLDADAAAVLADQLAQQQVAVRPAP